MAASRYWRIIGIDTHAGGDLELSELALLEGATRVDTTATLTTTVPPASGALSDLQDGSFATSARWPGDMVSRPGFALMWDFGAGVTKDISELRFAGPDAGRSALAFTLEYSSDGAEWSKRGVYIGVPHAGASAFAPVVLSTDPNIDLFELVMNAEGATLAQALSNQSPEAETFADFSASLDTTRFKFGSSSILFNGTSDYLSMKAEALLRGVGTSGDFCISMHARPAATNAIRTLWTFNELSSLRLLVNDGALQLQGIVTTIGSASLSWDAGTFYRIDVERYLGQISVYRDGVRVIGPAANTTDMNVPGFFHVGKNPNSGGTWFFSGNIDAMTVARFAQWKGAFTPPASAPGEWPANLIPYRQILRTPQTKAPIIGEDVAGPTIGSMSSAPSVLDIYDAGRGRIIGTVKEKGTPANHPLKRRVVLLSMPGSRPIRETWSDAATGAYVFNEIATDRRYTVISYDHTGVYRGVVADNLTPELMT